MLNSIIDYLSPCTLAAILSDLRNAEEQADNGDDVQRLNNVGEADAEDMINYAANSI